MRGLTRRSLLLAAGAGLVARPARASEFTYKDWHFDTDEVDGPLPDEIVRSLQAQIDIVESLTIKPEIMAVFRGVEVKVQSNLRSISGGFLHRNQSRRSAHIHKIVLSGVRVVPSENPFFLQLLLFDYLDERVPDGWRNADLWRFFNEARQSGTFANKADMLNTQGDFFAICTSVILWGRAAREPFTRARVREKLPGFYDWIVKAFTPDGTL